VAFEQCGEGSPSSENREEHKVEALILNAPKDHIFPCFFTIHSYQLSRLVFNATIKILCCSWRFLLSRHLEGKPHIYPQFSIWEESTRVRHNLSEFDVKAPSAILSLSLEMNWGSQSFCKKTMSCMHGPSVDHLHLPHLLFPIYLTHCSIYHHLRLIRTYPSQIFSPKF
jgi:hypothetical protein